MFNYTAVNPNTLQNRWNNDFIPCSTLNYDPYYYNSTIIKDNVMYLRPIRYPTPPNTPPRREYNEIITTGSWTIGTAMTDNCQLNSKINVIDDEQFKDINSLRTQTVIMKIGHVTSPIIEEKTERVSVNKDQAYLSNVINDSSNKNDKFICEWLHCSRLFSNLDSLAMHVTQTHAVSSRADGLYYCHWSGCQRIGRGFNARYKMLVHMRTHTKEKPHQCHLCEKRFSRAENLKIHIRSHSGEKPYVCTFEGCTKAYSNSSDRFKHTRTHSIEKPYVCKVNGCQKRYTDPSSLRKHVKTFKHTLQLIKDFSKPITRNQLENKIQQKQIVKDTSVKHTQEQLKKDINDEKKIQDNQHQPHTQDICCENWKLKELQSKEQDEFDQINHRDKLQQTLPNHCSDHKDSPILSLNQSQLNVTSNMYPVFKSTERFPVNSAAIPQRDTFCMALEELCQIDVPPVIEEEKVLSNHKSIWQHEMDQSNIHHSFHFPFFSAPLYELASYDNVSRQTFTEFGTPTIASNAIILPSYVPTESMFNAALDWEPLDLRINRI